MLLGNAPATTAAQREVWFDPQNPDQPLSNPHISISGETGSGKTQAVKAILHDFLPQGLPALILDFKDDYSKTRLRGSGGLHRPRRQLRESCPSTRWCRRSIRRAGRANPIAHVHELANMLQRIYRLGDQQAYQLREAMKETYEIAGIGIQALRAGARIRSTCRSRPSAMSSSARSNTTLLGRLSPDLRPRTLQPRAMRPQPSTTCSPLRRSSGSASCPAIR